MKPFVFRLHCKKQYELALCLINLCEHLHLNYTFDIEDLGDETQVTDLSIVIVIRGIRGDEE